MQKQNYDENLSSSDNDDEYVLVNESILGDNSTVVGSESERSVTEILPQQQPSATASSFTASSSNISSCSSSIDIDLEMLPTKPSTSNVLNKMAKPATCRSVFEFADRISKKDQVS